MTKPINTARILIVDDVPKNLEVLGETLSQEGYQISVAQNGKEAALPTRRATTEINTRRLNSARCWRIESCWARMADRPRRSLSI